MKINFTNKEGKTVLEMNSLDGNKMVVLDESLKDLAEEENVTDKSDSQEEEDDK